MVAGCWKAILADEAVYQNAAQGLAMLDGTPAVTSTLFVQAKTRTPGVRGVWHVIGQ